MMSTEGRLVLVEKLEGAEAIGKVVRSPYRRGETSRLFGQGPKNDPDQCDTGKSEVAV